VIVFVATSPRCRGEGWLDTPRRSATGDATHRRPSVRSLLRRPAHDRQGAPRPRGAAAGHPRHPVPHPAGDDRRGTSARPTWPSASRRWRSWRDCSGATWP